MNDITISRFGIEYIDWKLDEDRYFLPVYAIQRPAAKCFLEGSVWEPDTHKLVDHILSRAPGSMLHAGTFFGDMLPSFSRAATVVWCFEPVLENYVLARLVVEGNRLSNVNLFNGALSDICGSLKMSITDPRGQHRGGSSFVADEGVTVPAMRIDQFDYQDLKIIHLDVEDHEHMAIKGGIETIRKHLPLILTEDRSSEGCLILEQLGYHHIGRIPHLGIWAHADNPTLTRALEV